MKIKTNTKANTLFEISWEVCNKIGGIFTVLSSKAKQTQQHYNNYFLIGPYFQKSSRSIFKEKPIPEKYKAIYDKLKQQGIICHFGNWLIEGEPNVILVDFQNFWPQINKIKKELWERFKIDSLGSGYDFDEPILWSWAVGILIENMSIVDNDKKIVAHCHEWLSGAAILY